MMYSSLLLWASMLALGACAGCQAAPGRPAPNSEVLPPDRIAKFNILYSQNCAGCHGTGEKGGAAIGLGNKNFLAIVDNVALRRVIAQGVPGTAMPAFAQSSGGMLTDAQINDIVQGIRARWPAANLAGLAVPSYAAHTAGNPQQGLQVYDVFCSSCHGTAGRGGERAGSIVNPSYLALVSDQYLRTIVIAGRPDIGQPDWRDDVPGRPMSEQDVSDVIAWLLAQRPNRSTSANANSASARGASR